MEMNAIWEDVKISYSSDTPKYIQVSNAIIKALDEKRIKLDDFLPSINELSFSLDVSRDTVEKSYRHLKNIGIISSKPGRGYYINPAVYVEG